MATFWFCGFTPCKLVFKLLVHGHQFYSNTYLWMGNCAGFVSAVFTRWSDSPCRSSYSACWGDKLGGWSITNYCIGWKWYATSHSLNYQCWWFPLRQHLDKGKWGVRWGYVGWEIFETMFAFMERENRRVWEWVAKGSYPTQQNQVRQMGQLWNGDRIWFALPHPPSEWPFAPVYPSTTSSWALFV